MLFDSVIRAHFSGTADLSNTVRGYRTMTLSELSMLLTQDSAAKKMLLNTVI